MSNICPICSSEIVNKNRCDTCGYSLLEQTSGFKPIDVGSGDFEDQSKEIPASKEYENTLQIINGPQRGASYSIKGDSLTIGRDPSNDIFLNDRSVSRSHANLSFVGPMCQIKDLDSFNGLWINNKNVSSKILEDGDLIQIGSVVFKYIKTEK
ncbi:MAG: FHA domain-containing protein [Enterococcus sp.]|nr:FHA domain-containing protein [Enterococcus sp.]